LARDPQLGESIIWQGRPQQVETPTLFRVAALVWFVVAATATCFAFVAARGLGASPAALLLFAAWTASLGLACLHGPRIWNERVEYILTEGHVIWRRGPLRRVIPRKSISYARIFWRPDNPHIGDMELVRAVPTGASRRRLLLQLHGLAAPDKVWALIRGIELRSESNAGVRCISQRLDAGEHVLWSASPNIGARKYLPHGKRGWQTFALAVVLLAVTAAVTQRIAGILSKLLGAGLADHPSVLVALLVGEGLAGLLLLSVAASLLYYAIVRPARQLLSTRYLITNRRVLIQREHEELHLDRSQIVDVIDIPGARGLSDVFLVLDGPRARALELSGAFGESERDTLLRPILEGIADSDSIGRILLPQKTGGAALPV
jgi:hypothetical protein